MLPCQHEERITTQVQPTIDLLSNLDTLHPNVLREHAIDPADYHSGLVFRSAVESIRGSFIASSTNSREGFVENVLAHLKERNQIVDFERKRGSERFDFHAQLDRDPDYFMALEVKGGEGNSINISERPLWAKEFGVWCNLDGAIVNQPANGARAIISRLTNEMIRRQKHVDFLLIKDILCGTKTRPCPKYPGQETDIALRAAPDIFLFPKNPPSLENPEPPVHTLGSLRLPVRLLDLFGVSSTSRHKHLWEVHVKLERLSGNKLCRMVTVVHQGEIVGESRSRAWRI